MPASTQTALARHGAFHSGSTSIMVVEVYGFSQRYINHPFKECINLHSHGGGGGGLMATETTAIHGFFGVSINGCFHKWWINGFSQLYK